MWKKYKNKGKYSSIKSYKISKDKIFVKFEEKQEVFLFHKNRIGEAHLSSLIDCAKNGFGLLRYINQYHLEYQVI